MRRRFFKLAVVLVLLLCVCCYIAEICDTWDSASAGSDTEFSVVRLILCVGAALVFARFVHHWLGRILRSRLRTDSSVRVHSLRAVCRFSAPIILSGDLSLLALRI